MGIVERYKAYITMIVLCVVLLVVFGVGGVACGVRLALVVILDRPKTEK